VFGFKIDGAIDIGNSGIKIIFYKNKKIEKIDYIKYTEIEEDKLILLEESLEKLSKKINLKGKNMVVTLPATKFNTKTLEYTNIKNDEIREKIQVDLEELISGYRREDYVTQIETIYEDELYSKYLVVTILEEELEKIIGILSNFKIRILKIIPDFIAINNLIDILEQKSEEKINENIMVVDVGSETTKIFMSTLGVVNMLRIINIGGKDFTEIIKEHKMLGFKEAELEKYQIEIDENKKYNSQGEVAMFKDFFSLLENLKEQIEKSIEYFNSNLSQGEITKLYFIGGGMMLKGVKEYFENSFKSLYSEIKLENLGLEYKKIGYKKIKDKKILSELQLITLMGALIKEVK